MSHFCILVEAKDEKELAQKMLPFHEYESTGYDDYCEWVDDIHDENLENYNSQTLECIIHNGVILGSKYDDNPIIKSMWNRNNLGFSSKDEFVLLDGYDLVNIPFNEKYNSFDEYMEDWCGYTEKNPVTGKFSRWTNPNSKWDWYSVGGRWEGFLLDKNGNDISSGLGKEIDWDKMLSREIDKLKTTYLSFHNYMLEQNAPNKEENYNDWKTRNEEVEKIIPSLELYNKINYAFEQMGWFMWSLDDVQKLMALSLEEYSFPKGLTYAFIDEKGNWNQKGEMGWWGMYDKSKATNSYDEKWWQWISKEQ